MLKDEVGVCVLKAAEITFPQTVTCKSTLVVVLRSFLCEDVSYVN